MSTRLIIPRRTIAAAIGCVALLLVALVVYARLPQATIVVHPATHERSITQDITLSSQTTEPDFVRYILPAKMAEATVTERKVIERTGTQTFEDFARGQVTLINQQEEEQRLLPKTHLKHEATGAYFLIDKAVVVPPKDKITASVTAEEKGTVGNVAAGKFIIDRLPASLHSRIYAESTAGFSGGLSVDVPLAGEEITRAKEEVSRSARDKALAELATKAGGRRPNEQLTTMEVKEESASAEAGSKTTSFTVSTTITARGFFPDENDLLSLTLLALRSSPKPDEEFVSYNPNSFKMEIVRADFTRGEARARGTLAGSFAQKTGQNVFKADNLAGRSASEVEEYFKQFPSVAKVEVRFSPFWVRSIPARSSATEIVVKSEATK